MPAKKKPTGSAGYSGTPLPKKLGLKEGFRIALHGSPPNFRRVLGSLPPGAKIVATRGQPVDFVLLFARDLAELRKEFPRWTRHLTPAGMIWTAWPKKSSGVATDLGFAVVQKTGLAAGLVDIKVCAIDEIWSGLKFVRRLKDRK